MRVGRDRARLWRSVWLAGGLISGIALVLALAFAPPGHSANRILIGKVGFHDAYRISLAFPSGRRVKRIPAGTYTFVVHDYSAIHNFALGSQTENKRLFTGGVRSIGTKRYTRTLTPGIYAYACSAHPQTMNGTFIVTPA